MDDELRRVAIVSRGPSRSRRAYTVADKRLDIASPLECGSREYTLHDQVQCCGAVTKLSGPPHQPGNSKHEKWWLWLYPR